MLSALVNHLDGFSRGMVVRLYYECGVVSPSLMRFAANGKGLKELAGSR